MPRGDGTGPMGMGPMSGRAAGYCAGYPMPGFANSMGGRGMGRGRGWGRGYGQGMAWRRGWAGWGSPEPIYPVQPAPAAVPRDELQTLKSQAKYFGEALQGINKRIAQLEADAK